MAEKLEEQKEETSKVVKNLEIEVRDTREDTEGKLKRMEHEVEVMRSRGATPRGLTPRSGARSPEIGPDLLPEWLGGVGEVYPKGRRCQLQPPPGLSLRAYPFTPGEGRYHNGAWEGGGDSRSPSARRPGGQAGHHRLDPPGSDPSGRATPN